MSFHHSPNIRPLSGPRSVEQAEAILTEWFHAPVVLASSGRGAMLLYFEYLGLNRYRNNIAVSPHVSACVLDAIIRRAFPVDASKVYNADALVFYHQYGLTQRVVPRGRLILEDICHAFFSTASSGNRPWHGQVRIFSLPKFFGTLTMVGGLVVSNESTAKALRDFRDMRAPSDDGTRKRHAKSFQNGRGPELEITYLERLLNPAIHDSELGGVPLSLPDILTVGEQRAEVRNYFLTSLPPWLAQPTRLLVEEDLPYALPVLCPEGIDLREASSVIQAHGFPSSIYHIDVARNLHEPNLKSAWLFPCHQDVPLSSVVALCTDLGRLPVAK